MTKWLAGLAIAAATLAGMYAVASTTASSAAAAFVSEEATWRARVDAFAVAANRAGLAHREARARCKSLKGESRFECQALAREAEKRALERARESWSGPL